MRADRRTHKTKLLVAIRNFANTPKIALNTTDLLHIIWLKNDIIIPTKFENVTTFVTVDFSNILFHNSSPTVTCLAQTVNYLPSTN
jgi:hypothetical protein